MEYLIIGNGIAGVEAALSIRKNDSESKITILSEEKNLMYYRPRLIEYISGGVSFEKILAHPNEFYEKKKIINILGIIITDIDKNNKEVIDSEGNKYKYDKLLLAVGAKPFMPETKGNDKKGVFSLRTKEDAENIRNYCKGLKNIVVIGGGLLGIETANSLLKIVEKVTIVEYFDRLLPRQLDADGSKVLEKVLNKKGINFVLSDSVAEILGRDSVNKVLLNSGKELNADAVIYSIGIRCRLDLAKNIGLDINKGITVNKNMRTSDEHIYAAGDVTEFNERLFGQWIPAKEQGNIAGENMSGNIKEYKVSPVEARLKVTDISLFSVGKVDDEEKDFKISKEEGIYRKLIFDKGKLTGAIIVGDKKEELIVSKVLSGKSSIDEIDLGKYM